jgi:hypothetical protein
MEGKIVFEGKSEDGKIIFSVEIPTPKLNAEEAAFVKVDLENTLSMFLHILTGITFMGGLAGAGLSILNNALQNAAESLQKQLDSAKKKEILFS